MSDEQTEASPWSKYHNPDPRCTYPHDDNHAGYCWSYALYVDGEIEDMKGICRGCELYRDSAEDL